MYVFITGASSGIGKSFAYLYAQKGYNLILVARRKDRLINLKRELEKNYGISAKLIVADLSSRKNCFQVIETVKKYPIEIAINNAGFGITGYFSDTDLASDLNLIDTNITAVHIFTKYFAKHMKKGHILNVSSIAAHTTPPYFAVYGATKSYVYALSQAVNYELKQQKKDISITTLCPGLVATEFYKNGEQPNKRFTITPEDCAKIAMCGMQKKKAVVIPTASMKLSYLSTKLLPKVIMNPVQFHLQTKK